MTIENKFNLNRIFIKHGINPYELEDVGDEVLESQYYKKMFTIGNYKKAFREMVARFLIMNPIPNIEFRNKAIGILCEAYIAQTKEFPDGVQLHLLGNWVLVDDLKDPHPDKVSKTEYPILSKNQTRLRNRREIIYKYIYGKENTSSYFKKRVTSEPSYE